MLKKRMSRVDLHRKICELSGTRSKSNIGYLSRKEMMELLMYLERVQTVCLQLGRLQNAAVSTIIIDGKIYNEPASDRA